MLDTVVSETPLPSLPLTQMMCVDCYMLENLLKRKLIGPLSLKLDNGADYKLFCNMDLKE